MKSDHKNGIAIDELKTKIRGPVFVPEDDTYHEERKPHMETITSDWLK